MKHFWYWAAFASAIVGAFGEIALGRDPFWALNSSLWVLIALRDIEDRHENIDDKTMPAIGTEEVVKTNI